MIVCDQRDWAQEQHGTPCILQQRPYSQTHGESFIRRFLSACSRKINKMKETTSLSQPAAVTPPMQKISRLRWSIILVLLIAAVVNYLGRANISIANTTISKEFGFSATQMCLLLSAFLWPYALANLPAGWLVDKFGPKKMFSWALGLW